jgi:hypothetical protein
MEHIGTNKVKYVYRFDDDPIWSKHVAILYWNILFNNKLIEIEGGFSTMLIMWESQLEAFFQGYKPGFAGSNLGQDIGVSLFFLLPVVLVCEGMHRTV